MMFMAIEGRPPNRVAIRRPGWIMSGTSSTCGSAKKRHGSPVAYHAEHHLVSQTD